MTRKSLKHLKNICSCKQTVWAPNLVIHCILTWHYLVVYFFDIAKYILTLERRWEKINNLFCAEKHVNSFNKTEAAVFSCRLCFLRAFPFITFMCPLCDRCWWSPHATLCYLVIAVHRNVRILAKWGQQYMTIY